MDLTKRIEPPNGDLYAPEVAEKMVGRPEVVEVPNRGEVRGQVVAARTIEGGYAIELTVRVDDPQEPTEVFGFDDGYATGSPHENPPSF